MKTYIFGKRSFLSKKLFKYIKNSEVLSLNEKNNFNLKKNYAVSKNIILL